MKKVIQFSKAFIPLVIVSVVFILSGAYALVTKGLNLGLEFKSGLIQDIRIASPALSISYSGSAAISVQMSNHAIIFVVSGVGAENTAYTYSFAEYSTLGSLLAAILSIEGVSVTSLAPADISTVGLFANSDASSVLSADPFFFYYLPNDMGEVSIDAVRVALEKKLPSASVKQVGDIGLRTFQIRVGDDGTNESASDTAKKNIVEALSEEFGENNFAVLKTDFIAAQFSKTLMMQVVLLLSATIALIWLYATIRFKWDFALGAVLAIIHDAMVMFAFIAWKQMEVTTVTVAAILLIVGYSINDTIVVLDRVREKIRDPGLKVNCFSDVLNMCQTEILTRTIITTITTMFCAVSLYIFTTGSMKDFALALIVGLSSGVYSTIFIASAFIAFVRRNWKLSDEQKHTKGTLSSTGITV